MFYVVELEVYSVSRLAKLSERSDFFTRSAVFHQKPVPRSVKVLLIYCIYFFL